LSQKAERRRKEVQLRAVHGGLINRQVKPIGRHAGLPTVHAHMLRHGCGCALANANAEAIDEALRRSLATKANEELGHRVALAVRDMTLRIGGMLLLFAALATTKFR